MLKARRVLIFTSVAMVATMALPTAANAAQCSDPWVTQLTTKYLGHPPSSPNAPQCNIYLYRNGHWNSYAELDAAVAARYSVNPDPDPAGRAPPPPPGNIWSNAGSQAAGSGFASAMIQMPASSFGGRAAVGSQWQISGSTYQVTSVSGNNVTLRIVAQGGGNRQQGIVSTNGNNRHGY
jgi:hypothetical protein